MSRNINFDSNFAKKRNKRSLAAILPKWLEAGLDSLSISRNKKKGRTQGSPLLY